MKLSVSKRYLLIALGLLLITTLLGVDFARRYMRASALPGADSSDAASNEKGNPDTWSLLFERKVGEKEQFAVVAEKNVFSPLRKMWSPPPPPPPQAEAPAPEKPPVELPKREDIELRGTAVVGSQSKAMLRFKSFKSDQTQILAEGEIGKQKDTPGGPQFTVVKIETDSVLLKDAAGQQFRVGLYDHKREAPAVTKNEPTMAVAPVAPPAKAPAATSAVAGQTGSAAADAKANAEQSAQKNEDLVKEGKMKKISTPFGPVYRKQ